MTHLSRQRGVSLIELMVAMAIGLMLVLMVTSYLISSRQSYQTSTGNVDVQDAQRFALSVIQQQLWMTGYSDSWEAFDETFPAYDGADTDPPDFATAQLVASTREDEVWVRYRAPALASQPLTHCDGTTFPDSADVTDDRIAMTRFYLDGRTLRCKVYFSEGEPHNSLPLLNDVDALTWSYLDDSDRWQTYASVTDWQSIKAVRVGVILASAQAGAATEAQTFAWGNGEETFDDGKARVLVQATTALRNSPEAGP